MSEQTIDPDAVLDFKFDWSAWLSTGETISSHTVTPTYGISVDSTVADTTSVTAWVSGATGHKQKLTCHIATNQGREDDRSITLNVEHR